MSPLLYGLQDFPDQNFGGGRAGGYADFVFAFEPFALQVAGVVDHIGIDAALGGDFAQAVAVGRVGRADDDDDVAFFCQFFDGGLSVGRGVADVFFVRVADVGETGVQRGDDVFGFIDGQGSLADVGESMLLRFFALQGRCLYIFRRPLYQIPKIYAGYAPNGRQK